MFEKIKKNNKKIKRTKQNRICLTLSTHCMKILEEAAEKNCRTLHLEVLYRIIESINHKEKYIEAQMKKYNDLLNKRKNKKLGENHAHTNTECE